MTFWLVQADYRPLTERSPTYAFLSENGRTGKYIEKAFRRRYNHLSNVRVTELTEQEMESRSIRKWIMWI